MNLFQRAFAGLTLTPGERAFLKFVQHFGIAAAGAVLTAVLSYVASLQSLVTAGDYGQAVQLVGFVAASAACSAGYKFLTATGDTRLAPIASAASAYGSIFAQDAQNLGANAPHIPVESPTQVMPAVPAVPAVPADSPTPAAVPTA